MKNLKLKAARAAKDLSQEQLAQQCGVSRQTINAIEKGDYNPTINLCIAICKALDKTLNDLFWNEESNAPPMSVSDMGGVHDAAERNRIIIPSGA